MWARLRRRLVRASVALNRATTDRDRDLTFSAKSHALAVEGRWFGYLRCLLIDALWAPFEGAHCKRAYDHFLALRGGR